MYIILTKLDGETKFTSAPSWSSISTCFVLPNFVALAISENNVEN
jgi:hypothetical protein